MPSSLVGAPLSSPEEAAVSSGQERGSGPQPARLLRSCAVTRLRPRARSQASSSGKWGANPTSRL